MRVMSCRESFLPFYIGILDFNKVKRWLNKFNKENLHKKLEMNLLFEFYLINYISTSNVYAEMVEHLSTKLKNDP